MPKFGGNFATTHWSVVIAAGHDSTTQSRSALEALCSTYWYPVYVYVRRRGYGSDEAQDLAQEFFVRFLEKNYIPSITPAKGRFRSYLLTSVNHFLTNEWASRSRQKRGGGVQHVPIDLDNAENRYLKEGAEQETPETIYERRWACAVLDRVLDKIKEEFRRSGRVTLFEALNFCLSGDGAPGSYDKIAAELGISTSAVKVTIHRMRKRYAELLKEEIAQTVESEDEIEDELSCLLLALGK